MTQCHRVQILWMNDFFCSSAALDILILCKNWWCSTEWISWSSQIAYMASNKSLKKFDNHMH